MLLRLPVQVLCEHVYDDGTRCPESAQTWAKLRFFGVGQANEAQLDGIDVPPGWYAAPVNRLCCPAHSPTRRTRRTRK